MEEYTTIESFHKFQSYNSSIKTKIEVTRLKIFEIEKLYKPTNIVAGFESHSRRLALKLTSELEFYNQWKVV